MSKMPISSDKIVFTPEELDQAMEEWHDYFHGEANVNIFSLIREFPEKIIRWEELKAFLKHQDCQEEYVSLGKEELFSAARRYVKGNELTFNKIYTDTHDEAREILREAVKGALGDPKGFDRDRKDAIKSILTQDETLAKGILADMELMQQYAKEKILLLQDGAAMGADFAGQESAKLLKWQGFVDHLDLRIAKEKMASEAQEDVAIGAEADLDGAARADAGSATPRAGSVDSHASQRTPTPGTPRAFMAPGGGFFAAAGPLVKSDTISEV